MATNTTMDTTVNMNTSAVDTTVTPVPPTKVDDVDPLAWQRSLPPNESITGPIRVYCDGIYDLFHFGHMRSLKQAKDLFPNAEVTLVVGVCGDEVTWRNKGRTVLTGHERAEGLRHCKWVDEVVEDAPWLPDEAFVKKHRLDYIVHGDDNNGVYLDKNGNDVYAWAKEKGYFRLVKRTEGISTSDIITRILKDYDEYVRRNLKRGANRHELGLSWPREAVINAQDRIAGVKENTEATWKRMVGNVSKWSENISKFARKFTNNHDEDTDDETQHMQVQPETPKRRKLDEPSASTGITSPSVSATLSPRF